MKKDNSTELLPIVDEGGNVQGCATRGECHDGSKRLHPVVHLHLLNDGGQLYLQQRPQWKDIQPGKWDTAVGGHVDYGEGVNEALLREVKEELGIDNIEPQFILRYVFESERERELIYVYRAVYNGDVSPSEELDGGRFWDVEEVMASLDNGIFTPNFEQEFLRCMRGIMHGAPM